MTSLGETRLLSVPNIEIIPQEQPEAFILRLQRVKQFIGRTLLSVSLAVTAGMTAGVAAEVIDTNPSVAIAQDYPDGDAADCSNLFGVYSWCKDENENSRFDRGEQNSSRGYDYRNCTDWVAWRIPQLGVGSVPAGLGNGAEWNNNAPTSWTIDSSPEPGDIAHSETTSPFGHVGVVEGVNRDSSGRITSIEVSDFNRAGTGLHDTKSYTPDSNGTFWRDSQHTKKWDNFLDLNGTGKGIDNEPWPPTSGDVGGGIPTDKAHELAFVRLNHYSGNAEVMGYGGQPLYQGLRTHNTVPYPAINDPENVTPLAIDVNGDGIDELGFVRTNHSSGNTEIVLYHGAPSYQAHLATRITGYPAIADPENVVPIAVDVNGDKFDELGFVRLNHSSGRTELVVYGGGPDYRTLIGAFQTGYPAIADPENVTPIALDLNGDNIDELGFVRLNYWTGKAELISYHGSPHYHAQYAAGPTDAPAVTDPENVKVVALDINGDNVDELGFIRMNHPSGKAFMLAYHGSPHYQHPYIYTPTGYPAINDPRNVAVLPMLWPNP